MEEGTKIKINMYPITLIDEKGKMWILRAISYKSVQSEWQIRFRKR
jgi:hypothetical protein